MGAILSRQEGIKWISTDIGQTLQGNNEPKGRTL